MERIWNDIEQQQQQRLGHDHLNASMPQKMMTLHQTELVWLPVDTRVWDRRTQQLVTRVPRQALLSVYRAILEYRRQKDVPQQQQQQHDTDDTDHVKNILVRSDRDPPQLYRYLYYTEQDSLLYSSLSSSASASMWRNVLDQQRLLLPHRWQPIPHASDLIHNTNDNNHGNNNTNDLPESFYVPSVKPWDQVLVMNDNGITEQSPGAYTSCCDTGYTDPVGRQSPCADYWYMCGLGQRYVTNGSDRLAHLRNFTLIRLMQGSQLTLLAASEHARTCQPSQRPCSNGVR